MSRARVATVSIAVRCLLHKWHQIVRWSMWVFSYPRKLAAMSNVIFPFWCYTTILPLELQPTENCPHISINGRWFALGSFSCHWDVPGGLNTSALYSTPSLSNHFKPLESSQLHSIEKQQSSLSHANAATVGDSSKLNVTATHQQGWSIEGSKSWIQFRICQSSNSILEARGATIALNWKRSQKSKCRKL